MSVVISNGGSSRDIEKPTRSQKREAREVYSEPKATRSLQAAE